MRAGRLDEINVQLQGQRQKQEQDREHVSTKSVPSSRKMDRVKACISG